MEARLLFIHTLSPLHAGTGQGTGVIDLPIAREKSTSIPYLPGSSLKGVLRDTCYNKEVREKVFGPDIDRADEYAGSVQISDQHLLLFPVRSLKGIFAWVTSPYVLYRFCRDVQSIKNDDNLANLPDVPVPSSISTCFVSTQSLIVVDSSEVVFEDLKLGVENNELADKWAIWLAKKIFTEEKEQDMLKKRFCIVHDDVFCFLIDTATEVFARIRLQEDAKTVEKRCLWYEEALPTETILWGLALATPVKATPNEVFQVLSGLIKKPLQLGGKATVGRGLCRLKMVGGKQDENS